VDDPDADGSVPYAIQFQPATSNDPRYAGRTADDVPVTNVDDDTAGVSVDVLPNLTTTEMGGTATFRVVLNKAPTAGVIFFLQSTNPAEGTVAPSMLQFSADTWNVPQTVTVTGQQDMLADGNQPYAIVFEPAESSDMDYSGHLVNPVLLTNLDDEASPTVQTSPRRLIPRMRREAPPAAHPPR
jgi:hypothetical protein